MKDFLDKRGIFEYLNPDEYEIIIISNSRHSISSEKYG